MEKLRAKIERKRREERKNSVSVRLKPISLSVRSAGKSAAETVSSSAPFLEGKSNVSSAFDDDVNVSSDEEFDPKTQEALEKLINSVMANGISAEEDLKAKNRTNPAFWFLYDKTSAPFLNYRRHLIKAGIGGKSLSTPKKSVEVPVPVPKETPQTKLLTQSEGSSRKRKSRWESSDQSACSETFPIVVAPLIASHAQVPSVAQQSLLPRSTCPASPLVAYTESSSPDSSSSESRSLPVGQALIGAKPAAEIDQQKELTEEEVRALRAQMQARAIALRAVEKLQPHWGVDVDEEIEKGSWEHAKRREEMEKTKRDAEEKTQRSAGKHHLADFLPPEEHEKFVRILGQAKTGVAVDKSEYQDNRLTEENKGFKLLQKMGWTEGKGLGYSSQGITAPVNSGKAASDHQGLGAGTSNEISADDDEYSVYRKRMMLAYKHRPNPMNNPRRQYY